MVKFNIGDKIYNKENPDKIYTVKKRTDITHFDEKGEELNNFRRFIIFNEALRYGEVLTDDNFRTHNISRDDYIRIRTIYHDNRIFYHKMVNGEVVEFKELTV